MTKKVNPDKELEGIINKHLDSHGWRLSKLIHNGEMVECSIVTKGNNPKRIAKFSSLQDVARWTMRLSK